MQTENPQIHAVHFHLQHQTLFKPNLARGHGIHRQINFLNPNIGQEAQAPCVHSQDWDFRIATQMAASSTVPSPPMATSKSIRSTSSRVSKDAQSLARHAIIQNTFKIDSTIGAWINP